MNMYNTLTFFLPMWAFGFIGFIVGYWVGRDKRGEIDKPQEKECYRKKPFQRLLSDFWQRLINPSFWVMNTYYNKQWDEFIIDNLDNIRSIDRFTCEISGVCTWVSNYPYSYATPYPEKEKSDIRPSISTIKKLRKAVIKNSLEQILEDA